MFSIPPKMNFCHAVAQFTYVSANAFNFGSSKMLLCGLTVRNNGKNKAGNSLPHNLHFERP